MAEESNNDQQFDIHGFLISCEEENEISRCSGCFKPFRCTEVSDGEENLKQTKWVELLSADKLKEEHRETFDYQVRVAELNVELNALGWCHEQSLSSLSGLVDLETKNQKTTPTNLCVMVQVLKDIDRTFPNHKMFIFGDDKKIQLLHILLLYARYNKAIGYCQGMAYIAALLLMYIEDEESVFWCFTYLLDNQFHHFYDSDLKRIKVFAETVRLIVIEKYPKLGSLLESTKVHPLMYATQWFMSLFTGLNCWDAVLYIVHLVFSEGVHQLVNAALAILKSCEDELLSMTKLDEILPFLQNIPPDLVHRECLESIIDNNGCPQFHSMKELEGYLEEGEKIVDREDRELEERKKSYLRRSSRKRQLEETDDDDNASLVGQGSSNVPSKRRKKAPSSAMKRLPATPVASNTRRSATSAIKSIIKTSSIKKTALNSVRKGRAELCYTKEAGLVYTSPNTMEMKQLPLGNRLAGGVDSKGCEKENVLAVKLSYDSHCDDLHQCT